MVNECKWLGMNVNDQEWMYMMENEMNVNDCDECKWLRMNVNDCEWM